jgi:hypothetical protein
MDLSDLLILMVPSTRTGWAILAVFVLPVIGALLLVSAIFWNAGA